MELTVRDIMRLLEIDEETVIKMIENGRIPSYKINNRFMFNKAEIKEWALNNNVNVSSKILELSITGRPISLYELIKQGGIHRDVAGETSAQVIKNAAKIIPLPPEISADEAVFSLLEREEMMPTAIGRGLAMPHARNPLISDVEHERVSLCFLHDKADFGAIDGEAVSTLFIVLSSKPARHLEIVSKISFLCRQEVFVTMLKQRPPDEEILCFIDRQEKQWAQKITK